MSRGGTLSEPRKPRSSLSRHILPVPTGHPVMLRGLKRSTPPIESSRAHGHHPFNLRWNHMDCLRTGSRLSVHVCYDGGVKRPTIKI
jgi:hypothetical protein